MNDVPELNTADAVRAHYGPPSHLSLAKELTRLDHHCRAFIALSPFLVISSSDEQGRCDATPRGDMPGFVAVLDDRRVLIPDRKGNNRADTMLNVTQNAHVGLLFLVPGISETLRVNGTVRITTDVELLTPLMADGKIPITALLVEIEKVFFQCGKALIRSDLWNPARRIERGQFPSLGRILADQIGSGDAATLDQNINERYKTALY